MDLVNDLLDLFDETIVVRVGSLSASGAWTQTSVLDARPARFEGGAHTVRSQNGQDVTSMLLAILTGTLPTYDATRLRFDLPSVYPQNSRVTAVRVEPVRDETGVIAVEVHFP